MYDILKWFVLVTLMTVDSHPSWVAACVTQTVDVVTTSAGAVTLVDAT